MIDLVLDTNILLHAANPIEARNADCVELLRLFWSNEIKICVDEGFSIEQSRNRSQIGSEYLARVIHGTLGYALILHLAQNQRISIASRKVAETTNRVINRHVRSKNDRIFIKVAHNSSSKTLVSHDFNDIPQQSREQIKRSIEVHIGEARTVLDLLGSNEP